MAQDATKRHPIAGVAATIKRKKEGEPQLHDSPYVLAAGAGFDSATFGYETAWFTGGSV